jgi:broad specificity phosphatase PhoE
MKLLFAVAAVMLAGCVSAGPERGKQAIYVMRHLHKAEGQDPGLSAIGQRCAAALAEQLAGRGIGAIYVSTTRRARETAAPLAARLRVAASDYDPRDTPGLTARARAETGSVLIVGHSNTVPDIVAALGGARLADLTDESYGDIWRVGRDGAVSAEKVTGC